jgi:acyl-CoA thioesterase I
MCKGLIVAACAVASVACGPNAERRAERAEPVARQTGAPPVENTVASVRPRVVILGDSLTAGLGLPIDEAYPSLLQKWINDAGLQYEVVNAGVSGDTSAGGASRLDWALQGHVKVLVVALGGNDALRALPVEELGQNLSTIIEHAQAKHVQVVLAGMEAPRNFGRDYDVRFHQVYPELAKKYMVPLVPFLLQDVAGIERLNQPDGIHPTAEGAQIVAKNVWTVLKPLLANDRS